MDNSMRQAWEKLTKRGRLLIFREYLSRVAMMLILFLTSGNWRWVNAWIYLFFAIALLFPIHFFVVRKNPDLYNERATRHTDTKSFDKVLLPLYALGGYSVFFIAGFDERFHWSTLPDPLIYVGIILMICTGILSTTSMHANRFFSATVRLQKERGQVVISHGPYAYVRHPGYVGGILFYFGAFCMLDSLWMIIPILFTIIILIIRTKLEDDTLRAELKGYKEYTQKVRYRLFPGIW